MVENLVNKIISMKKSGANLGCKVNEYKMILDVLSDKSPCNFLIFGLGWDSTIWVEANSKGRTYFIENIKYWINKNKNIQSNLVKIFNVEYTTKRYQWKNIINNKKALFLPIPHEIERVKWDIIFIDGPWGFRSNHPGRMQSIYMASTLAKMSSSVDIFVHDVQRVVERRYSRKYFGKENIVSTINSMRHFKIGLTGVGK